MAKLNAQRVRSLKEPKKYGDQRGLMLRVTPTGSKQWVWRGTIRGRRRDLGLGGFPYVTLREARTKAFEYRRIARQGGDPTAGRSTVPTFREATEKVIQLYAPKWKPGGLSEKHWRSTLEAYAFPHLGDVAVNQITGRGCDGLSCSDLEPQRGNRPVSPPASLGCHALGSSAGFQRRQPGGPEDQSSPG